MYAIEQIPLLNIMLEIVFGRTMEAFAEDVTAVGKQNKKLNQNLLLFVKFDDLQDYNKKDKIA